MPNKANAMIRVLIADDHKIIRQGLVSILEHHADIKIVGEASDGQMAVELAPQLLPDVILMDMNLPVLNGVEATRRILASLPKTRIIGLSVFQEEDWSEAMFKAGVVACLNKGDSADKLIAAIRDANQA